MNDLAHKIEQNTRSERVAPTQKANDARPHHVGGTGVDDPTVTAQQEVREITFKSMQELMASPVAPKHPIFRDLLFPGAWLLVGRPKIGKSWLLLQMALALTEGSPFLSFACAEAGEVLYVAGEDDDTRIHSRLSALGVVNAPAGCHLINQQELLALAKRFAETLPFTQFLDTWLQQHPRVRLVLLDTEATCRQLWSAEGSSDGARVIEVDYKQTRAFDELALRLQVAIVLVNHASKRKGPEWVDIHELINRSNTALAGASGSIALADPPDADPLDPKQRMRVLGIRGRDLQEDILLAIEQRQETPDFYSLGEYVEVRQTQAEQEVLSALEELMTEAGDEYVTAAQIAEHLGRNRETVKRTVSRMLKRNVTTWRRYRVKSKVGKGGGLRLEEL